MKNIKKMLPFMDSEDLYELAQEIINNGIDADLEDLFPFMDEDDLSKLVKDVTEKNYKINYSSIIPFLDEKDVYILATDAIARKNEFKLDELLPFMDEKDVDKICIQLTENPDCNCNVTLSELYQFASSDCVDKIFLHNAKQGKFDENALAFVSEKILHEFVCEYCKNPQEDINLDALYPYLESKDLALLLKTYLKTHKK